MRNKLPAILKVITRSPVEAASMLDPGKLTHLKGSLTVYALALLGLIWALAIAYIVADRSRTTESAEQELLSLAAGLKLQTEAMLADGVGAAIAVATRLDANGSLEPTDPAAIFRALRFELTGGEYIAGLFIQTPSGTHIVLRDGQQILLPEPVQWQVPRVPDAAIMLFGEPIAHPSRRDHRVIPIGQPFGGSQRIVAGAWYDIEALQQRYASLSIRDGVIGLVGPNGRTFARTAFGTMTDVPVSPGRQPTAEDDRLRQSVNSTPIIFTGQSAAQGVGMMYGVSRPVSSAQLFAVIGRTQETIAAPYLVRMWAVVIVTALASTLVIMLTVFLYRYVIALYERETQFRQLIDSSLVSVYLLKSGRIIQANQKAVEMFRVPRAASLIGLTPSDLWPELQPNGVASNVAAQPYLDQFAREHKTTFRWTHKRLDNGEPFLSDASLSGILVEGERLTLVIVHDVSALEAARTDLQRANETLEQRVTDRTEELEGANTHLAAVNQELEAFTAAASHDLRSPLSMISGQAGMLEIELGAAATERQRDRVNRIHAGVRRAVGVIDGLLSLSRTSRQEVHRENINLSTLVRRAVGEMQELEPAREVSCEIEDDAWVIADSRLMQSLITNVVENAWKYSANKPRVEIRFYTEIAPEGRTFCISDRGAGFDMAHAKELFVPFRRLHSAADFPGTGVGLAIVARVVHRYGGRIWAQSEVGNGATFRFTLPLALVSERRTVDSGR